MDVKTISPEIILDICNRLYYKYFYPSTNQPLKYIDIEGNRLYGVMDDGNIALFPEITEDMINQYETEKRN